MRVFHFKGTENLAQMEMAARCVGPDQQEHSQDSDEVNRPNEAMIAFPGNAHERWA